MTGFVHPIQRAGYALPSLNLTEYDKYGNLVARSSSIPNMELTGRIHITMHAFPMETYMCVLSRRRLACLMGCVTLPEA